MGRCSTASRCRALAGRAHLTGHPQLRPAYARLLATVTAVLLLLAGPVGEASAAWIVSAAGSTAAQAGALAPPSALTVGGQSCTPTSSPTPKTISYRDGSSATGPGTVTVPRPAGAVAGDVLVALYVIQSGTLPATPATWSYATTVTHVTAGSLTIGIYTKAAAADDPVDWTWTSTVTDRSAAVTMGAYVNVNAVNVYNGGTAGVGGTGTSVTAPSHTPTVAGTHLLGLFTTATATTMTAPASMAARSSVTSTVGASGLTALLADEPYGTTSPTGVRTATAGAAANNIGLLLALRPVITPGTIAYVGAAGATGGSLGGASVVLTSPAGVRAGDVMVVGYGKRKSAATITPPAGWTLLRHDYFDAKEYQQAVYWRIATSADPPGSSYEWVSSDAENVAAVLSVHRGVDPAAPVAAHGAATNGAGSTITAPSLTPSRPDTRLVGFFGITGGRTITADAPGMTSRGSVVTAGPGGGAEQVTMELEDQPWPAAGTATGTRTVTASGNGRGVGQLVSLKAESYPLAALSWTATTSTYAEDYRLGREEGGVETTSTIISPASSTSHTTGSTNRLTAGTTYTLRLRSRVGSWISAGDASTSFTAITSC